MSNHPAGFGDARGRKASYLRLSVTDRCNLRCFYCVSGKRQQFIPHERILRYEEYYRLIAIAARQGVKKARITGGEPFARLDLVKFLFGIRSRFDDLRLAITTNATLIQPHLADLARLKLASVNVSLDSFDRATFQRITASDSLGLVLANIEALLSLGVRVKLNAVALAGVTDAQLGDFIHFARNYPVDIRFIEYMPMGGNTLWHESGYIACAKLRKLASGLAELKPCAEADVLAGPARMYELAGGRGRLGFISALSDHFCAACNRLRVTSEGNLRTCLFADSEIRLAPLLRHPKVSDASIGRALAGAIFKKPLGADLLAAKSRAAVASGQMVGIGG